MSHSLKILFLGEPKSANTINWVEGFRELGCQVKMASARSDGTDGAEPIGNPLLPPRIRLLTGLASLNQLIADFQPDILLAYRVTSYGYLASKTKFHPLVIAAQNEQITYMDRPSWWRQKFLARCAREAIQAADLMHAWGHNIKDGLLSFGAEEEKIMVLHRGIDMTTFLQPNQPNRSYNSKKPVFISTRSLTHEYLIDNLIHAFKTVIEQVPEATLIIVGDGPEKDNLEAIASSLNLNSNVIFKGRLPLPEVGKELEAADFYISLIQTEGISSSLIEACACGLTPIVADIPASKELVSDNLNGYLLKSIEPTMVAKRILEAINNTNLQQGISENTTRIQQNYNRLINLQKFIDKYNDLIK